MKKKLIVLLSALTFMLGVAAPAQADTDDIFCYVGPEISATAQCFDTEVALNEAIEASGSWTIAILYRHIYGTGGEFHFTSDYKYCSTGVTYRFNLTQYWIDNVASSADPSGHNVHWDSGCKMRIFDRSTYSGDYYDCPTRNECLTFGDMNDKASSVEIKKR